MGKVAAVITTTTPMELSVLEGCEDAAAERTIRCKRGGPMFVGHGDTDYVCGSCGAVLAAGMRHGQLAGTIFRCARCDARNRVPGGKPVRRRAECAARAA